MGCSDSKAGGAAGTASDTGGDAAVDRIEIDLQLSDSDQMDAPLWKLLADAASCPITISIGGEPVEARSFADWSSQTAVDSTLVLAEPFTAVKDGACVIENQAEVAGSGPPSTN